MEAGIVDASKLEPREYQSRIAESVIADGNSLVILPTGLGKTIVALLVIADKLSKGRKALFLAPTRPLSEQHHKSMRSLLKIPPERVVLLTGSTPAAKRPALWKDALVVCATPQTIENDLQAGRISLDGFGLCVVDECHRSVKKYAYTSVTGECLGKGVQLLGLTASPGGKRERIEEVTQALGIENIQIRTETDPDVAPYVKKVAVTWVEVKLPQEFSDLKGKLEVVVSERLSPLHGMRLVGTTSPRIPRRAILDAGKRLMALPDSNKLKFVMLSHYATSMNLAHALELLETQGLSAFLAFFRKLEAREPRSKAVKRILEDRRIREILREAGELAPKIEHPKLAKLVEILKSRPDQKIIVFVQFRDQITRVVQELDKNGIPARQFVGKREGVKLRDQKLAIAEFREGRFNVLVASSIGEEGLDVPSVDTVVFYEPVPSEIRLIQRRGRAGRAKSGEVIFLITKGTRDEAYNYASRSREAKMRSIVRGMQARKPGEPAKPAPRPAKPGQRMKPGQARMPDFV
ncbi:MAG: helicase-related protein [Candidatus ainarchaeum sp.]|nr:helicase-related protein [Candidatus ainarchaeum sp.]